MKVVQLLLAYQSGKFLGLVHCAILRVFAKIEGIRKRVMIGIVGSVC